MENIDVYWNHIKEWWININYEDYKYDTNIETVSIEEKKKFHIKFLYIIQLILNIDNIDDILDKKVMKKIKMKNIIKNFKNNYQIIEQFIKNDIELNEYTLYFLYYKNYLSLFKNKILNILDPLINDEYFLKLFKCDDDISRVMAPLGGTFLYIYLLKKNLEETFIIMLTIDDVYIRFFIVSYLIIDNFMDCNDNDKYTKKIFLNWFMKIVHYPNEKIILNDDENKIWQCHVFNKYFSEFIEKYNYEENKEIYEYSKEMIKILQQSHIIQNNCNSNHDQILEYTFKKSYAVSFFLGMIINKKLNIILNHEYNETRILACKLLYLIQLFDDFVDYEKDINEKNYTYFNYSSINYLEQDFNHRLKKLLASIKQFDKDINIKDPQLRNIILYVIKNIFPLFLNQLREYIDDDIKNYFCSYSVLSLNILNYFHKKIYNAYEENAVLKYVYEKYKRIEIKNRNKID